jgi:hypothetical protein
MCRGMFFSVFYALVLVLAGNVSASVPAGWSNQDIGITRSGSAFESGGTWTIKGNGDDIWNNSDAFHYAYVSLSGDGEIIARVVSNGYGSNDWAKGGVMIRETLDPDSKHVMMVVTGGEGGGKAFQGRSTTGGSSFSSHGGSQVSSPLWVMLKRIGDTFTGYYSLNGIDWIQQPSSFGGDGTVNPRIIYMDTDVYIGLCVTSHSYGELRTFTFDNVTVTFDNVTPEFPTLASDPSPADGALHPEKWANLSWTKGYNSDSHDVYFGENFADVEAGIHGTFQGNQRSTYLNVGLPGSPYPDGLVPGTTYYWRVDEVESNGTTHKGNVWSFTIFRAGCGVRGDYYRGTNFENHVFTRLDPQINFDWGASAPDPAMDIDDFSVRWTGEIVPEFTETYTFYTRSDDGVRLWVDGQRIISNWTDHAVTENEGVIDLVGGRVYDIRMEMYENYGDAVAQLRWESDSTPKQIVPQHALPYCNTLSNDDCLCAQSVGEVTDLSFDTTYATFDGPGHYMTSPNLWFCYTPSQSGLVTVSLVGSKFDTKLAIYRGDGRCPTSSDFLVGNDDYYFTQSRVSFCVKAGNEYLIEVGGFNMNVKGEGVMSISCDDPFANCQANDFCEDAECIGDIKDLEFDTEYATFDGPGHRSNRPNVWYRYFPISTGYVDVVLSGSNTLMVIYKADECHPSPQDEIESIENSSDERVSEKRVLVFAGEHYLIELMGQGNFSVMSASYTDCERFRDCWQYPESIGEVRDLKFDTEDATFDGAGHCMIGPNIWYCYTASRTGIATVSLDGSNFDTMLAVYEGRYSYPTLCNMIDCDDDSGNGLASKVTFPVIAGDEYMIEVGSNSADEADWGYISIQID